MGELVEGEDAAFGQVLPDGVERGSGGFVEIEIEVGQGNDGVWVLLQVGREGGAYVDSDTEALATIIVDDKADPEFWSPAEAYEALYVHRMIVKRSLAGHDLGAVLLDWADELAGQARRHWLRLDAWRTNTALHDYYRHQGFAHVRTVDLAHRGSGALFQRKISQNRQHANFHISTDGTSAEIALPAGSETRPWG